MHTCPKTDSSAAPHQRIENSTTSLENSLLSVEVTKRETAGTQIKVIGMS